MAVKQETVHNDLTVEGVITAQGINSPELSALKTDVAVVQTQAAMAQGTAAAISAAMADDGIITPEEKKVLLRELGAIEAEYPTIVANAQGAGILADNPLRILYVDAYTDLTGELGDILSTMSASTAVDRDAFMALVDAYTGARAALVQGTSTALSSGITKASIVLELGSQTITRSRAGGMTPAALLCRALRQDQSPYLGRFVVALSHDNQTYQDAYTSSADESQINYLVPATMTVGAEEKYVTSIRVRLYAAGGTDTLLGERMASISLGAVAPVYWGPFTDAGAWPTGGLLAGDYLLDTREPASGGGVLRTWNGTAWVEYTGSMAGHPQAMAIAMTDLMVWAKQYGVTTIAAVNAIFQSVAASQAFIETLSTVNVKILGTVRTGDGASTEARIAAQDQFGVYSKVFSGAGNNDLSVVADGEEAGTFIVKITKDVARYPVGSTGPAGGKVFYTDPTDGYVLEAMPSDHQAADHWGANLVSGASGTAVRTGEANTEAAYLAEGWGQIGSASPIASVSRSALTRLNATDIALIDDNNDQLRTYRWNETNWAQVGNSLSISGVGIPALTTLNSTDVAFIDSSNDQLRTYRWNGTDWAQMGNSLSISGTSTPALAALNSTDVAFIDSSNDQLRTYRWNGTDWAQIGVSLSISSVGWPRLAKLNSTDVAFIDTWNQQLRTYRWSGTSWAQVGSSKTILDFGYGAMAVLNATDVAILNDQDGNQQLRTYRWSGTSWAQVGESLAVGYIPYPSMTALNSTDVVYIDLGNQELRTYRWYGPRAARTAADLSYGGYSDWFLPSKDELALMYTNRTAIGGFASNTYWSSSEKDASMAWLQNFADGSQAPYPKEMLANVRAIRKFYIKDHFQWNKDGGSWSAEQEITAGAQYDLGATSGIKIAFGGHVGHVLDDQWTLIQGSMYGLSIKDSVGDEYVKASNGALMIKELQSMAGAVFPFSLIITGNTTLSPTDTHILVNTANAVAITLPTTFPVGKEITITRVAASANAITVARSGSELIEDAATFNTHEGQASAVLNLSAVVLRKVTSTAWRFVGGVVSGSNSNGSWVKFSDGTMMQWGALDTPSLGFQAQGGWYYAPRLISFGIPFVNRTYTVIANGILHNNGIKSFTAGGGLFPSSTVSTFYTEVWSPSSATVRCNLEWIAIGRWRA